MIANIVATLALASVIAALVFLTMAVSYGLPIAASNMMLLVTGNKLLSGGLGILWLASLFPMLCLSKYMEIGKETKDDQVKFLEIFWFVVATPIFLPLTLLWRGASFVYASVPTKSQLEQKAKAKAEERKRLGDPFANDYLVSSIEGNK